MANRFAAIGTDGMSEVVWGIGDTAEAAESEARIEAGESDCSPDLVRTVAVSDEIIMRIERGEVSVLTLGI